MFENFLTRTFLIERITGVIVYSLVVIITYIKIKSSISSKQINNALNLCTIILGVLAFFYIPAQESDLYRWLIISNEWHGVPINEFVDTHIVNNSTPISYLLMYLCAQTSFQGLLPAICCIVFFHNSFMILKDLQTEYSISNSKQKVTISTAFLLFMSSGAFLEVISGVRCFVAFSFIARAFYFEIYREKNIVKSIPLYIMAALIHNAVIPIIAIRFVYLLFQKSKNYRKKIWNLLVIMLFTVLIVIGGRVYIYNAFAKANNYIFGDNYSYIWEYLIGFIQWCLFVYIISESKRFNPNNDSIHMTNIIKLNKLFLAIEILLFFEYNIFHRMMLISSLLITPVIGELQNNTIKTNSSKSIVFIISILILLIASARGNLCGYKFFLLTQ